MDADAKRQKRREANKRYYAKRKASQGAVAEAPEAKPAREGVRVSLEAVRRSMARLRVPDAPKAAVNPFAVYKPFKGTMGGQELAMDAAIEQASEWAYGSVEAGSLGFSGIEGFIGYPELSILAQRPEYRRISETIATEMTREWIELTSSGDDDKSKVIAQIEAEMARLKVRDRFAEAAEQDGFFGRSHIYVDLGTTDDPGELKTDIGDGSTDGTVQKVGKGSIKALRCVEAVWCYPTSYNSTNPLRSDWYRPDMWTVQGTEIHRSRLLTFIGREVPDLLKPAYSFGGLSMSQIAKPYVENWLRTRQSVADIISAFSIFVISTNMSEVLSGQDSEGFFNRLSMFTNIRDNRGVMAIDKDREDFKNVSAPLGSLDKLQAQTQEHMAAVSGIPLVKLTGISPSGLNASSEEEMDCFETWIHAYQEKLFRLNLQTVLRLVQISLFGQVDPAISFKWKPLAAMSETDLATVRKTEAETDKTYVEANIIGVKEVRTRLAADPDSPYMGINPNEAPAVPPRVKAEIAAGLTQAIVSAADAVPQEAVLSELAKLSVETGVWSSITPEMIADAEAAPPMPGEADDPANSGQAAAEPPQFAADAEPPQGHKWVTVNGSHVLVDGHGNVVAGAGGKLSATHGAPVTRSPGNTEPEAKSQPQQSTAEPSAKPEATPAPQSESAKALSAMQSSETVEHPGVAGGVTKAHRYALAHYTGESYRNINEHLAAGKPASEKDQQTIRDLDDLMERSSLPKAKTVHRGMGSLAVMNMIKTCGGEVKKGKVFEISAFTSTSDNPGIAQSFANASSKGIVAEIKLPKGAKAVDVSKFSSMGAVEQETLLARNSKVKVVSYDPKKRKIVLEIV